MDDELHDLIELVNTAAPQHSNEKSELITLLVLWNSQLDLLHDFLDRASEFVPEIWDDAQGVLDEIEGLKRGTRWGEDGADL